ncbi:MAG TPA: hypothetical protein VHK65_04430 [Candidatus Dormibacteraeota bacterium]|nr:hypothetical protein [Candidatus Dormibacteraeota bacterium]
MPVPPFPAVVAVAIGVLLLLRLVGGSMPWGQLMIAVGPDGRPMRPRVKWHLWTICRGEPPLMTAALGFVSIVLGLLALYFVGPELAEAISHPVARWLVYLMLFTLGASGTVVPVGVIVLVRSGLDLAARRSSMVGVVVGMRRDVGLFGRTYRVAIQGGDRVMTKRLWAEAFRVNRTTFDRLRPGDRITIEYSPHLRYVYHMVMPEPLKKAVG